MPSQFDELPPGVYRPLYERQVGPTYDQMFEFEMDPSAASPAGLSYTLPRPILPDLDTGPGLKEREMELAEEWLRQRNRWSIPGAETGPYRSGQKDWTDLTSQDVRRKVATWDDDTRARYYEPFQKQALSEQSERQQRYAKFQNELRYAQGLELMYDRMGSILGNMEGLGRAEAMDIERQYQQMAGRTAQQMVSQGGSSSTVYGAAMRGVSRDRTQAMGGLRERLRKERTGMEYALTSDIAQWVGGRTDEYPSTTEMAQLMFQSGASGRGQEAPEHGNPAGSAGAGIAMGLIGAMLCCFIFMEARYGTGTLDYVVRRFRDEMITARNRRGYYKRSDVLVPMMRKHWWVKALVRIFMTDPLVSYGKWYYRDEYKQPSLSRYFGWVFAPVKSFWLATFDYLGGEHEFIRANGEVI